VVNGQGVEKGELGDVFNRKETKLPGELKEKNRRRLDDELGEIIHVDVMGGEKLDCCEKLIRRRKGN